MRQRFHALHPGLVLAAVEEVDLAGIVGEVARRVRGDVAVYDTIDLGRATEIALVGNQRHRLVRRVALDCEGPGADGFGSEVVAEFLHGLLANDVAALIVGEDAQHAGRPSLELDLDRGGIRRLDRGDVGVVRGERRDLGIARPFEREHHVVGAELAIAVVALDSLAQVKGPGELVGRRVPALGEIGLDRFRVHRPRLEADQSVEHPADDRLVGRRRAAMWVERPQIGGRHADIEHFLRLRWRDDCKQQRANEAGGHRRKIPHRFAPSSSGFAAEACRGTAPLKRPMSNAPSGLGDAPVLTSSSMMIPITGPS